MRSERRQLGVGAARRSSARAGRPRVTSSAPASPTSHTPRSRAPARAPCAAGARAARGRAGRRAVPGPPARRAVVRAALRAQTRRAPERVQLGDDPGVRERHEGHRGRQRLEPAASPRPPRRTASCRAASTRSRSCPSGAASARRSAGATAPPASSGSAAPRRSRTASRRRSDGAGSPGRRRAAARARAWPCRARPAPCRCSPAPAAAELLHRRLEGGVVLRGPLGERRVTGPSMRMSRAIGMLRPVRLGASERRSSLADQALDLAAVGATLRLPHHGADDGADRLLVAARIFSTASALSAIAFSTIASSSSLARAAEALRLDHGAGSPPSATSTSSTSLAALRHLLVGDHRHELARAPRAPASVAAGSASPSRAASSFVTQLASARGVGGVAGRERPLEEVAELRLVGEQRARSPPAGRVRSSRSARAAGSSGSASRARSSISSVGASGTRSGSGK